MEPISVMLSGVGGYGRLYVSGLLECAAAGRVRIVGAVDPYPSGEGYERLKAEGVPVYAAIDELYAQHNPELAVVCCPTPFHAEQTVFCLEHGSHVLVEKPIAPAMAAAEAMIRARDKSGRHLVVGYQWCFQDTMLRLRAAARSGEFGAPKKLRAIVMWPRDEDYYRRGVGWAGKRYTADGREVFDNVASNATAHYPMNMLWMAGYGENGVDVSAVDAVCARANDIEMFDSVCMNVSLTNGAVISFAASHAVPKDAMQDPMFIYDFERASVSFGVLNGVGEKLTVTRNDGSVTDFGNVIQFDNAAGKLARTLDIIAGKADNPCPPELAIGHTKAMDLVNSGFGGSVQVFPPERVNLDGKLRWVAGLAEEMRAFYEGGALPASL